MRRTSIGLFILATSAVMTLSACGGGNDNASDAGNTATTEMLSTETTLDGTTNDATSMDAAAGSNNEVATTGNETAADNATAQ